MVCLNKGSATDAQYIYIYIYTYNIILYIKFHVLNNVIYIILIQWWGSVAGQCLNILYIQFVLWNLFYSHHEQCVHIRMAQLQIILKNLDMACFVHVRVHRIGVNCIQQESPGWAVPHILYIQFVLWNLFYSYHEQCVHIRMAQLQIILKNLDMACFVHVRVHRIGVNCIQQESPKMLARWKPSSISK